MLWLPQARESAAESSTIVHAIEQRISLITLGVADLRRARAFYEQLGWSGQEVQETVFFQTGGLAVELWGRAKVAADAGIDDDRIGTFGGIVLEHTTSQSARRSTTLSAPQQAPAGR